MNIKKLQLDSIENIKHLAPKIYKESLKTSVPFYMLHKSLFEKGEEVLTKDFALSQSELDVLATLLFSNANDGTLTPTELYDIMIFSSGGMTKVLKKLELKGYISRIDNDKDKRSKLVKITPQGKSITTEALKTMIEFDDTYFSKLNQSEQKILQKLLYKMLDI